MAEKKIIVLGTTERGGIRSVIEAYERAGFYRPGRHRFIASHVEAGLTRRLAAAAKAYVRVLGLLLTRQAALFHLHVSMRGSFWRKAGFIALAKLFGVPVLVHLHGSEFRVFYEARSPRLRGLIRGVLNQAQAIVVLSEGWRQFVSRLTAVPVTVIGNFIDDGFEPARAAAREPHAALFLGKFGARKGIYDLVPAFGAVHARFPAAVLHCGGNGEIEATRRCVRDHGLEAAVQVPGWIGADEKRTLMHKCSVFVLPSYNEGLPMAIIEAMSFAMVIIATRVGGIPELVEDGVSGFLIEAGDRSGLTRALCDVFGRTPDEIAAMGRASRRVYEARFAPAAALARMHEVYASLGVRP